MYSFQEFKTDLQNISEFFKKDLSSVQTGRATPLVLDGVMVEAYGSWTPIAHLGAINIEDSKTLFVTVYDKSQISDVEKAINDANLGLSISSQTGGVRVTFPSLTGDRRIQYVKLAKDKLEDARVKVKSLREKIKKDIENKGKEGEFGKDDEKRFLDEMQVLVNNINAELENIFSEKEYSILND